MRGQQTQDSGEDALAETRAYGTHDVASTIDGTTRAPADERAGDAEV
jgi:hypothetical protein